MKNFSTRTTTVKLLFTMLSVISLLACDTSGNEGVDPLPEDPLEQTDPNVAVALEQIVVSKIGNAIRLRIIPETGKNLEFMTGSGDFTVKTTLDIEGLKTPDRTSANGNFTSFKNERTDTVWISKTSKLHLTFITKEGLTEGGAIRGISFPDVPAIKRILEESLFAY